MGRLQLDPLAADIGPVFAPIKLKGFAGLEHQRHEGATPCCLLRSVSVSTPRAGKCCHATVRSIITKLPQISVHLLHSAALFAWLSRLHQ